MRPGYFLAQREANMDWKKFEEELPPAYAHVVTYGLMEGYGIAMCSGQRDCMFTGVEMPMEKMHGQYWALLDGPGTKGG